MKNKHIAALTGGISTGKTTISKYFQTEFGFYIIDADKVGHEILGYPRVISAIVEEFGNFIVKKGHIDRKVLGSVVFNDPLKLKKLNTITHPVLIDRSLEIIGTLHNKPIIFEAAVLVEAGWEKYFNTVILSTCSIDIQIHRTMTRNSLSKVEARQRIETQISDSERRKYADFIVDTSYGLEPVCEKLNKIAQTLLRKTR